MAVLSDLHGKEFGQQLAATFGHQCQVSLVLTGQDVLCTMRMTVATPPPDRHKYQLQ